MSCCTRHLLSLLQSNLCIPNLINFCLTEKRKKERERNLIPVCDEEIVTAFNGTWERGERNGLGLKYNKLLTLKIKKRKGKRNERDRKKKERKDYKPQ